MQCCYDERIPVVVGQSPSKHVTYGLQNKHPSSNRFWSPHPPLKNIAAHRCRLCRRPTAAAQHEHGSCGGACFTWRAQNCSTTVAVKSGVSGTTCFKPRAQSMEKQGAVPSNNTEAAVKHGPTDNSSGVLASLHHAPTSTCSVL